MSMTPPPPGGESPPAPGYWKASDGHWYPPTLAPGGHASAAPPPPGAARAAYSTQPTKTNGLAVASLVLGIVWLWFIGSILALVFGYIARKQIDESNGSQTGRGMAVAGIVLGWIGLAGVLLLIVAIQILGQEATTSFSSTGSAIN